MDAGVVELDALADADGAGAQYDDGLLLTVFADELQSLVLAAGFLRVVGGVEVGGVGGELAGAGVHHLKGGLALEGYLAAGEPGDGGIGIAQLLALGVQLLGELALGQFPLVVEQVQYLGEEPAVDHGFLRASSQWTRPALRARTRRTAARRWRGWRCATGSPSALGGELGQVQGVQGDFRARAQPSSKPSRRCRRWT